MERITILESDLPLIGLYTRTITYGEEYSLVKQFVEYYSHQFTQNNKKLGLAVFIEPRVSSGFPDLVLASYLPSIVDNWSDARKNLTVSDLKVLSHLLLTRGAGGSHLITSLRLPEKQTLTSLEKLLDAKLISYKNKCWCPRNLRDVFSIVKLVSVEAKINNVNKVVEQSLINTWFASHSYALTNVSKPQNETLKAFSRHGIGLYCKNSGFQKVLEAEQMKLPSSYQSLQFNEWIGNNLAV